MAQLRAVAQPSGETHSHGLVLASIVLALPGVIAARASAGSLLIAVSALVAAAFLERRPRASLRIAEVSRATVSTPVLVRSGPRARWELVERNGRSSLEMHWR